MTREDPISVSYGRGHLPLDMPAEAVATVIRKRPLPKIADPAAAIETALAAPIGAPPLSELARGRQSACILICDVTRPVPNKLFLRPMIETMIAAGIPADRIDVLVATGLHDRMRAPSWRNWSATRGCCKPCASPTISRAMSRTMSTSA